jgi:alpha-L-fucosidase 2
VYARLFEAEHSYELIADVLDTKTHGNLWTTHPPFQIDANFGYAAAVNEMLAQSHTGEIHLLPALPKAWSKGQVKGMRVRGGFELDMRWDAGKLVEAKVRNVSSPDGKFRVLYKGATKDFKVDRGQSLTLTAAMLSK